MRVGERIDGWTLLGFIGKGGSGEVWSANKGDAPNVALKILWRRKYAERFLDEIRLYRQLGDHPGILRLVDSYMPVSSQAESGRRPWLAMEIGVPITEHLGPDADLADVVKAVESYAKTLAGLADENIFHRDIKPSNLYWANDQFAIGDFGIADFPGKAGLTETGEKLGPANYLAPEMIEYSGDVQSGPADVYSLAKTLWAITTRNRFPPQGELRRDRDSLRLSSHVQGREAVMLEALLERATADNAGTRPSMREFAEELFWWGEPQVSTRPDLTSYRDEVARLQEATTIVSQETEDERLGRLYNDAMMQVGEELFNYVKDALESAGLQSIQEGPRTVVNWSPHPDYGGGGSSSSWGIRTLASPWISMKAGVAQRIYREENREDLEDLKVFLLLAVLTPESQHNYFEFSEDFRPGSLSLDRAIERIRGEMDHRMPDVISDFLSRCKATGVPRQLGHMTPVGLSGTPEVLPAQTLARLQVSLQGRDAL
jgi:serine/threonine protein kinase